MTTATAARAAIQPIASSHATTPGRGFPPTTHTRPVQSRTDMSLLLSRTDMGTAKISSLRNTGWTRANGPKARASAWNP